MTESEKADATSWEADLELFFEILESGGHAEEFFGAWEKKMLRETEEVTWSYNWQSKRR